MSENNKLRLQLEELLAQCNDLRDSQRKSVDEKNSLFQELSSVKDVLSTKKTEADRELRNKEKIEKELKETKAALEEKLKEIASKDEILHKTKEEMGRSEVHSKDQKHALDKLSKEHDVLNIKMAKLQLDYEQQILHVTKLLSENQKGLNEIKVKDEQLIKFKEEMKTMNRNREMLTKKLKQGEDARIELEKEKDSVKVVIGFM